MKAEISVDQIGCGSIRLDGTEVSHFVRGFTLEASIGSVTHMGLDVVVTRAEVEAETVVVPEVYDLLVRLGWIPPGGVA